MLNISVGDIVSLASDNLLMTVATLDQDSELAECIWRDKHDYIQSKVFPIALLTKDGDEDAVLFNIVTI